MTACISGIGKATSLSCYFALADEIGTNFLVRTCVDRLAQDGGCTIAAEMKKAPVKGRHRIQARNKLGESYVKQSWKSKFEQLARCFHPWESGRTILT